MFEEEGEVLKEKWLRMAMMEGHHHHVDDKNKFKGGQSRMVVVRIVEQLLSVFSLFEERYRNVKKVLDRNSHTVKRFVSWNVDDDMIDYIHEMRMVKFGLSSSIVVAVAAGAIK
jgi:hypothetical protein